jgi:hypothetical protein
MATDERPAPSRRTGARVTPKGGPTKKVGGSQPEASTRYTPPVRKGGGPSPRWLPVLMLGLVALGVLVIFLHYVDMVLPGASSNWWLLAGLMSILGGILAATQYR